MRLGRVVLVLAAASMSVVACSDDAAGRDDAGRLTSSGSVSVFDLEVGDCGLLDPDVEAEVGSVSAIPCSEPHELEVYAVVEYEESDAFPGPDALASFAEMECAARFADYVGVDYLDSELYFTYLLPTLRSWDEGEDRSVLCFATTTGEKITGSVEGSGR